MTDSADAAPSIFRWREGALASLFLLLAALVQLLITRTDVISFAPQEPLYLITAGLFALAIPGPLIRLWDLAGQLFFWNAIGWATGLILFGLGSVGALPMLPVILAFFGLSFWPREPETTVPLQAAAIAALGGLLVCYMAWGDVVFSIPSDYTDWI